MHSESGKDSKPVLMTEFILQTDAKDRGIEAVLSLMEDGQEHPVG